MLKRAVFGDFLPSEYYANFTEKRLREENNCERRNNDNENKKSARKDINFNNSESANDNSSGKINNSNQIINKNKKEIREIFDLGDYELDKNNGNRKIAEEIMKANDDVNDDEDDGGNKTMSEYIDQIPTKAKRYLCRRAAILYSRTPREFYKMMMGKYDKTVKKKSKKEINKDIHHRQQCENNIVIADIEQHDDNNSGYDPDKDDFILREDHVHNEENEQCDGRLENDADIDEYSGETEGINVNNLYDKFQDDNDEDYSSHTKEHDSKQKWKRNIHAKSIIDRRHNCNFTSSENKRSRKRAKHDHILIENWNEATSKKKQSTDVEEKNVYIKKNSSMKEDTSKHEGSDNKKKKKMLEFKDDFRGKFKCTLCPNKIFISEDDLNKHLHSKKHLNRLQQWEEEEKTNDVFNSRGHKKSIKIASNQIHVNDTGAAFTDSTNSIRESLSIKTKSINPRKKRRNRKLTEEQIKKKKEKFQKKKRRRVERQKSHSS